LSQQSCQFEHPLGPTQSVVSHIRRGCKVEQDALIEFLKSLRVLPPGAKDLVLDEHYRPKVWPSFRQTETRISPPPEPSGF